VIRPVPPPTPRIFNATVPRVSPLLVEALRVAVDRLFDAETDAKPKACELQTTRAA